MSPEHGEPSFETNTSQPTPEQIEAELMAKKVEASVDNIQDIQAQAEQNKVLFSSTETQKAQEAKASETEETLLPESPNIESAEPSAENDVVNESEKTDAEAQAEVEKAEELLQEQKKEEQKKEAREEISEIFEGNDRQEINQIIDINLGKEGFQQKILSGENGYLTKESINLSLDKYVNSAGGTSEHEKMLLFKKALEYFATAAEMKEDTEPNWHNTDSYSLLNSLDNRPAESLDEADRVELAAEAEQPFGCQIALKENSEQKGLSPDTSRDQAESLKDEAITGEDMKEVRVPASELQKVQSWFEKKGLSEVKVVPIEFFEIKKIIQSNMV